MKLRRSFLAILLSVAGTAAVAAETAIPFPFMQDGKQGFIDRVGKVVIAPQFDEIEPFSDGLARVKQGEKYGFVDPAGRLVIPVQYEDVEDFSEGLAIVRIGDRWGAIDKTGELVMAPRLAHITALPRFSEGLLRVPLAPGPWGFVDRTGKVVIPGLFESANDFSEGLSRIVMADGDGYADKTGKIVIAALFVKGGAYDFKEGLAVVQRKSDHKVGYIDKTGRYVIEPRFDSGLEFQEGLAGVKVGAKWGFIDKAGKFVVEPSYDYAGSFAEGLAMVLVGDKGQFVDKTGKTAIAGSFMVPGGEAYLWRVRFRDGLVLLVLEPGTVGYIDKTGKVIWKVSLPPA